MATDRGAGLASGLVLAGLYTAYAIFQIPFAFLRAALHWLRRWDDGELPPHQDPRRVTRYSAELLDALRKIGDPTADALVARIATGAAAGPAGQGAAAAQGAGPAPGVPIPATPAELANIQGFYDILLGLGHRYLDLAPFAGQPYLPDLQAWVAEQSMPAPFDRDRVERAARFFRDHAFRVALILSTSSLLETFACAKGVKVLAQTGFFSHETNRRLSESLQFVLHVNAPEAFAGGNAINAILRVRLMHAVIRWRVPREIAWDEAKLGVPINQEDLLGTLMTFSGIVVRDLPKLWVNVSGDEADDYIYLWKVVGPVLGVRPDLMPNSFGEALALIWAIEARQQEYSDEGVAMTRALVAFHRAFLGELMDPIGYWMMRRLAGDRVCDIVEIPHSTLAGVTAPRRVLVTPAFRWSEYVLLRGPMKVDGFRVINGVEILPKYELPASMRGIVDELSD